MLALALTLVALAAPAPLPDLDQATPFGLSVVERDGRSLLVFGSAVDNKGPGDLVVEGRRWGGEMRTWQVLGRRRLPLPVRLQYVRAETHQHWHYPNFERYELRSTGGRIVARDRKSGFCLRDAYETHAFGKRPRFTGECAQRRPEATELRQGISPGFGDDYVPEKEGQSIDVTGLASGRYVLVHRANPDRILRERTYTNNAASVLIRLDGGGVQILRRCPATDVCGT